MGVGAAFISYFLPTTALVVMMLISAASSADSGAMNQQCGNDFTKVTDCLTYATGKSPSPTKQCCDATTSIRETDPACLCYLIEMTHNGTGDIRSLGIQESRLIQLPAACKIKNASISDCTKLLGIPPSSPLYSIFTNTSSAVSPVTTSSEANSSTAIDASEGIKLHNYHFITIAFPFVFAVILSAISYIA